MPRYGQNSGRWHSQRRNWDSERERGSWRGPREESYWQTPGTEFATASTGDEDWRPDYRGGPGGYGAWNGGDDWSAAPEFAGEFGRRRVGYGGSSGRDYPYPDMPGGNRGRGMSSDYDRDWSRSYGGYGGEDGPDRFGGYPAGPDYGGDWQRGSFGDYGEGRWSAGTTDEFGPGRFRGGTGGQGRFDRFDRFGGRSWQGGESFAGRGPRGYQRSDDRIREDVCEILTAHWDVDATDIDVHVQSGEVTLVGSVANRDQKRMAEDAIESVPGIRDVHNQLRVPQIQHGSLGGTSDGASSTTATGSSRGRTESGQHREAVGADSSANSKPR